jgi:hypothetical protein
MLNTIPQDPSSVMRFVDGADERQLMSMVSSKNPYSFMALAKLQSIRDAKMKEQAGQPMPPPMSEQIPQQLAQLASGQQPHAATHAATHAASYATTYATTYATPAATGNSQHWR